MPHYNLGHYTLRMCLFKYHYIVFSNFIWLVRNHVIAQITETLATFAPCPRSCALYLIIWRPLRSRPT